jgi:chromosomal replication initiation ATPase DnaA
MPFDFGHEVSLSESDFMVGESNRMALEHLRAYPGWPGPLTLLTGPAKAGKSHLARIWRERSGAVPAPPSGLEPLSTTHRDVPVVVEDVDRVGYDEHALFHLLNQSMRDGRPVLMTARAGIAAWPFLTDDLKSRARLATLLVVAPADDILLSHMLIKLFADRQVAVDPRIIGYIVPRMERSAEEAVALVDLMDRMALGRGSAITRALAADALAERALNRDGQGSRRDLMGDNDE